MSLDISLKTKYPIKKKGTGIFIRESGATRELSLEEARDRYPEAEILESEEESYEVYSTNITHNLTSMADAAGLYYALWRPEEMNLSMAGELIPLLEDGLEKLQADPEKYEAFNPSNGWGSYDQLLMTVGEYLSACRKYPDALIEVDR